MRIIGGKLKGRTLQGPSSHAIRPTSDRLRETIFNILQFSYQDAANGARVLDLFAGTGAMALEALSRGACLALLIDQGAEAIALMRANINALGLSAAAARILRRDALRLGKAPAGERFNLAFLDPPYGRGLVRPALDSLSEGAWLERDALVMIEEAKATEIVLPGGYELLETRTYGDTQILFVRAETTT
jgi:16S rRNA (guanine966-N2)-methyltransferase